MIPFSAAFRAKGEALSPCNEWRCGVATHSACIAQHVHLASKRGEKRLHPLQAAQGNRERPHPPGLVHVHMTTMLECSICFLHLNIGNAWSGFLSPPDSSAPPGIFLPFLLLGFPFLSGLGTSSPWFPMQGILILHIFPSFSLYPLLSSPVFQDYLGYFFFVPSSSRCFSNILGDPFLSCSTLFFLRSHFFSP